MRLSKHLKSQRYYLQLFKVKNATNANDGQIMNLYFGKYKNKFKFGFFVREINEFKEKFT
ncbi:MAG: hypothetical protein WCV71_02310 [Patescibacteria group bacterium]